MASPIDGILLVDKQEGQTSFRVVQQIKRMVEAPKVGHSGTLDPFATGLLLLLLGQGTKLSNFLMTEKKVYCGTLTMGVETDTLDCTGRVVRRIPVRHVSSDEIQKMAAGFVGEIDQVPPPYSAVKYNGTRAYKLARKGANVSLKSRRVIIHALHILNVDPPHVTFEVTCSKGTYVRSLAADMGRELGTGAHLKRLRRLASGSFKVDNAIKLSETGNVEKPLDVRSRVIPLRWALPLMPEIELNESLAKKVRNGYQPGWSDFGVGGGAIEKHIKYVKLVKGQELVAIAKMESQNLRELSVRITRVFY